MELREVDLSLPFHNSAFDNPSDGWMIDRVNVSRSALGITTKRKRALGLSIDLSIRPSERSHQEDATF